MKQKLLGSVLSALALLGLSACGGSGSSGSANNSGGGTPIAGGGGTTPTPTPTPTSGQCSLRMRQDWAFRQIQETYLFPELLPAALDPSPFPTVQAYIDAIVAEARDRGFDQGFTFITSIAEENAFFASGATAGFGIRLTFDSTASRLFVIDAFEGAPALSAGIDRGTEILAIGTSTANLQSVASLFASGGAGAVSDALGPSTAGTARVLQFRSRDGSETTATVTKTEFDMPAVSPRFGALILEDRGRRIGYFNMRTFIDSAEAQMIDAFNNFRQQGISDFIIDLRYNGGGLVRTAELFGDLLGGNRSSSDVFSFTEFRPSLAANNSRRNFRSRSQAVSPVRIAYIGTQSTASASELVINAMDPYLAANQALIGANTSGKPVGQIARDRAECDDRLRVVAFETLNAQREGRYFTGLAPILPRTCQAADDLTMALGDPDEASIAQALDFLSGESCTPIGATSSSGNLQGQSPSLLLPDAMLMPARPTMAQREVPGSF